ncbi:beta strand repeat-containing protein [Shimia thalassica]|uniref:beta strand repeat-containing protein n=2 Tax=Shimia thalassica TaxID=1715693 RepID=UPI0026E1AAC0|nr:FG-GAP-like repeat-containing protein [Shimia thalassica]MDO6482713.1 FG-GAP-like repeat-containing protein [Shimia thalassica]
MTAPTLTGFAPTITLTENLLNETPQLLDADVTFTDVEGNFFGGILSLTGLLAEDTVSVRNEGSGAGEIGLSGAAVTYGGVTIGTLAGGAGAALTITFNAAATSVSIDALIQNLTYANSSDTPTASRDLVLNVTDAAGEDLGPIQGTPVFAELTGAANPFNVAMVGIYSAPTFVDLDGDGDLDLVSGNYDGTLVVYDNNDADDGFSNYGTIGGIYTVGTSRAAFVDLDGDGDLDIVVGHTEGEFQVFDNNDGDAGFTELTDIANPFDGVDVGSFSAPTFVDLDGDGDQDMVAGALDGTLRVFDNNDADAGFTELTGAANTLNSIDAGYVDVPTFVDLDGDGDLDLVVGESQGAVLVYDNNDADGGFTQLTGAANPFSAIATSYWAAPSFVDLDGDGDQEAVIGDDIGILTFNNTTPHGAALTVAVTAENDAPVLTDFSSTVSFDENTVNADPQLLDVDVTFADAEGNFDGGRLSLTGLLAEDALSVRDQGAGAGEIGLTGLTLVSGESGELQQSANVTFGGVTIGTLSGGLGESLWFTFNAAATTAAIEALIQNLTYANKSDSPTASRNLVLNVRDAAGDDLNAGAGLTLAVTVVAENDAPTLSGFDLAISFDENAVNEGPQFLDRDVTFFDAEDNFDGGVLSLTGLQAEDTVSVHHQGTGLGEIGVSGADVTFDGVTIGTLAGGAGAALTVTFNAAATTDAIEALIQNLTYSNSSDAPTTSRNLALNVVDAAGLDLGLAQLPPIFTQLLGTDNPFDGIDAGYRSNPAFADLDGDGDLDMVVGEDYGTLQVYDNNDADDGYTQLTGAANPFNSVVIAGSPYGGSDVSPVFVDLDGDGDLDLVVGGYEGTLRVFDNNDDDTGFTELTGLDNVLAGIDPGNRSVPAFADLDGDGDRDVLVGDVTGRLNVYDGLEELQLVPNPFSSVDVGYDAKPTFFDLDGDGDLDLLLGSYNGTIHVFDNNDGDLGFTELTGVDNPFDGLDGGNSSPRFVDLDGDDDLDLVVGNFLGNITAFENTPVRGEISTITVNAENDAPVLSGFAPSVTFDENTVNVDPQSLDNDVTLLDAEGNFDGGSLTVSNLLSEETVSVRNQGTGVGEIGLSGANVTYGGATIGTLAGGMGAALVITFNATATTTSIEVLIENLTYTNSNDAPLAPQDLVLNLTDAAGDDLGALQGTPIYSELTGAANVFDGVDVGDRSSPTFVDLDGDGDLDVVVGALDGKLRVFDNNDADDGFTELDELSNPLGHIDDGDVSNPAFADIDGDGDQDLVIGYSTGWLVFYDNNGGAGGFTRYIGGDNPFAGFADGLIGPVVPNFVDLDGDGDLDFVVNDDNGTFLLFDNNDGDAGYTELTGAANPLDGLVNGLSSVTATFVDFDGDGDLDLVTGDAYGFNVVYEKNDGDAGFTELVGDDYPFISTVFPYVSVPAFADLDGDGDLDLIVGETGGTLSSFENTTPHGQAIAVAVTPENDRPSLTGVVTDVTLAENTVNATPQLLDSDVTFIDADQNVDGGSLYVTGLLAEDTVSVRNQGTGAGEIGLSGAAVTYAGVTIGTLSGGMGATLSIAFNSAATSVAVDALIENLTYANSSDTPTSNRELVLYVDDAEGEALGPLDGTPTFAPLPADSDPFDGLDLSFASAPAFADLDGDGDLDVVFGEVYGTLRVFDNNDADVGYTELVGASNPFGDVDVGDRSSPTFVDLDGDGDLDLVVGESEGELLLFDNNDADDGFTQLTGLANPFDEMAVPYSSSPVFVDLDGDGDLDLVVGNGDGTLQVLDNNDGDSNFTELTGAANPFDGVNVGYESSPTFFDLDGDGDLDAVVGSNFGVLRVFDNNDGDAGFTELTGAANVFDGISVPSFSRPGFSDLDEDGDIDLILGETFGTLVSYENILPVAHRINLTVTSENDAPVLGGVPASLTFAENSVDVNVSPQRLLEGVTLADSEDNFDGGSLSLSGLLAEDFIFIPIGSAVEGIGLTGSTITYDGVNIGTWDGGYAGSTLTATFNASATSTAIEALLGVLRYGNSSQTPTANRDLLLNVVDGDGADFGAIPMPPSFVELTGAANPFDGISVVHNSTPAFVDLDGDGDLDVVVSESLGTLRVWDKNDDDAGFTELTGAANPLNGIDIGPEDPEIPADPAPTFVDLDGDGDLDLVAGESYGSFEVWDNNDDDAGFTELTGAANPLDGLSSGRWSTPIFVDLDGDGDLDLLSGNRYGNIKLFDKDDVGAGFTELTGAANPLDFIDIGYESRPAFADLDGDGDLDLVVGSHNGTLRVFDNNDADTGFTELTGAANPWDGVDLGYVSRPTFVDMDGDGDLDLVSGSNSGTLHTFENTAPRGQFIDLAVTAENDAPALYSFAEAVTFAENDVNVTARLLDTDVTVNDWEQNFDGGVLSLTGLLPEDIVSVRNQGTASGEIGISGANVTYGGVIVGTLSGGVGAALTVTFNAAASWESVSGLARNLTYMNSSDAPTASRDFILNMTDAAGDDLGPVTGTPDFVELEGAANPFDSIDVGIVSNPTFVDLDGDGDLDLVVTNVSGTLHVFDNNDGDTGFTELSGAANPFDGLASLILAAPTFADMDGDGDLDLVIGSYDGTLRIADNNDADDGFTEVAFAANPLNGVDVGNDSTPTFVDVDEDGDLDLVVGGYDGALRLFDNNDDDTGFTQLTGGDNPFDGVSVVSSTTIAPTFADLDSDGDLDLIVGGYFGGLQVFDNNDADMGYTQLTGAANPFDGVDVGYNSKPTFVDLDGDGDLDLVVGAYDGTVSAFENTTPHGQVMTVSVTPENDPTTFTGLVSEITVLEDTPSDLDLSAIELGDADNNEVFRLAITADSGTMSALSSGTVAVFGSGTSSLLLAGLASEIDAYLNAGSAVQYTGALDVFGSPAAQVTLTANDGAGGIPLGTVQVNITDVVDIQTGTSGNDRLQGGIGVDSLIGNAGNDTLRGLEGADTLSGGDGFDWVQYTGSSSGVTVDLAVDGFGFQSATGGDATGDVLSGFERVLGSDHADTLNGNDENNYLIGRAGADSLVGGLGNDTLRGGLDADTISGGDGIDLLQYVGSASGVTVGLSVDGFGFQSASGGDATDDVISGFEQVLGSAHADMLSSSNNGNTLIGGAGNDTLLGADGSDTLRGGQGADSLEGGNGIDWLQYFGSSSGVTINLSEDGFGYQSATGGDATGDVISGFERVRGSGHSDDLTGDANNNVLIGMTGSDTLTGGEGNDTLIGGRDADTMAGGIGIDWVQYNHSSSGVTIDLTVDGFGYQSASGGDAAGDVISGFERVIGSSHADVLTGAGDNDYFIGGAGNDTLSGGGGDDTLRGGADADTLSGGDDIDLLQYVGSSSGVIVDLNEDEFGYQSAIGGDAAGDVISGFEEVLGSAHADMLTGNAGDNNLTGGAGTDTLSGGEGNDSLRGGTGADTLDGGNGADWVQYIGSSSAVTVDLNADGFGFQSATGGDATGDVISGFERVRGSDHADTLTGNASSNTLLGGSGNDTLTGGEGNDTLRGGADADTFAFSSGDGYDLIDGEDGLDTVQYIGFDSTDFQIIDLAGADWTVTEIATGDVDTLVSIETLVFNNTSLFVF